MIKICSWCKKDLGRVEAENKPADTITHGICNECASHLFAQIGMPIREYINTLESPVAILNGDGSVCTVNGKAVELIKKRLAEIDGFLAGEIFECKYATLPGGCGNTIHCSGCTIRNTVTDTYKTGTSHIRIPATLHKSTPDKEEDICMYISTEKAGNYVLLKID